MKKNRVGDNIFYTANYTFFILAAMLMIYPLWYVFMASISDNEKIILNNYYLLPNGFSLNAYRVVMALPDLFKSYGNTIFVTVAGTVYNIIITVMTAYPLSRDRLRGKKIIFNLFLFTAIFSGGLIPYYLVVRSLGMVDSIWVFIIPGALDIYLLLIMIKFFKGIPQSLLESAKMDGYNEMSILFKIVLPLSPAVIATIALFYAVGHWNNYTTGLIFVNTRSKQVLQVIIQGLLISEQMTREVRRPDMRTSPLVIRMAAIVVSVLPILMVYPFVQKYFITGMTLGAVKE